MLRSWIARVLLIACLGWLALPFELVAHPDTLTTAIDEKERRLFEVQRDIAVLKEATRLRLGAQETRLQKDLQHLQLRIEEQDAQFAGQLATQFEAQEESLQKDLYELQSRIERQDGQLADIHAETARLHLFLVIFASFLTLLVAATGVATWYSAGTRARDMMQAWIAQHESERNAGGREALSKIRGDVVTKFGEAMEPILSEQVVKAWLNKGLALGRLTRHAEALAAYEQVIMYFGEATEPVLREQVAKALFNKGVALGRLTRSAEALAAYEQVMIRFGEATEPVLREQVVKALLNKGVALGRLTRSVEAIAAYEEVISRFGEAVEPVLREGVAKALANKGATLGRLARYEEAIAAYDQVVARFGMAPELFLREGVAKVLVNKGVALDRLGRSEEATAVYEDAMARFGEATEPSVRAQVMRALNSMGLHLLRQAKLFWDDREARTQLLAAARVNFDRVLEWEAQNASTLGNLGYLLFLSGQPDQALESLQYALTLGGEELYRDMVKDAETDTVLEDAEFRVLLDRIWQED
ncbi:hypothetical protein EMGBD2_02040 [Nitrospirota bacterium]|nr:hypothetical protein EMGBD2_02040 [Nitrospirota bacterium]GDX88145.1 hypothetical protein LBMAG45_00010 [Nitrospirota bacterium]